MKLPHNPLVHPINPQDRPVADMVRMVAVVMLALVMLAFAGLQVAGDMHDGTMPPAVAAATPHDAPASMPPEVDAAPSEQDQELRSYAAHGG